MNRETSQSSERDTLRQRFSVATHPQLPILLCSDGYSVTVLRLMNGLSLSQLVMGLATSSQDIPGLSQYKIKEPDGLPPCETKREPGGVEGQSSMAGPETEPSHFQAGSDTIREENQSAGSKVVHPPSTGVSQHHRLHPLMLHDLGSCLQGSDVESTFTTSLMSTGLGFLTGLSGLEAGAIHFAGVDSDLDRTHTSTLGKVPLQQAAETAVSQLNAAWGLLVSTGYLEPGNGVYPPDKPLGATEIKTHHSSLHSAAELVISLLSLLVKAQLRVTDVSSLENPLASALELASTVLSLVSLDSNRSHLTWVLSLSSMILFALLSFCLESHNKFKATTATEHTLQSLREFADKVAKDVTTTTAFLNEILLQLSNVYRLDSASTSFLFVTFYPKAIEGTRQNSSDSLLSQLVVPLHSLSQVVEVLWDDIRTCSSIAAKIRLRSKTSRLQLRELGLLHNNLVNSVSKAVGILQTTHAQITRLLNSSLSGPGVKSLAEGPNVESLAEGPDNEQSAMVETGPREPTSNPITSEPRQSLGTPSLLPRSGSVSDCLSDLFKMLEQYDLKGALDFAHSFIVDSQESAELNNLLSQSKPILPIPTSSSDPAVAMSQSQVGRATHSQSTSAPSQYPLASNQNPTLISFQVLETMSEWNLDTCKKVSVKSDSGLAVVTSLARAMVAFFSNQPLVIAPPSNPFVLSPCVATDLPGTNHPRYLELNRAAVTKVIREQELTELFTVDHTLQLLLLCGLWKESCEFVSDLGDWRKGFILACIRWHHCRRMNEKYSSEVQVSPATLAELESFASQQAMEKVLQVLSSSQLADGPSSIVHKGRSAQEQSELSPRASELQKMSVKFFSSVRASCIEGTLPHKKEVFDFVSSTFQVCAFAELDSVLLGATATLLHQLVECCRHLSVLVPSAVYLPAPPLYCPQPGISNEVHIRVYVLYVHTC